VTRPVHRALVVPLWLWFAQAALGAGIPDTWVPARWD